MIEVLCTLYEPPFRPARPLPLVLAPFLRLLAGALFQQYSFAYCQLTLWFLLSWAWRLAFSSSLQVQQQPSRFRARVGERSVYLSQLRSDSLLGISDCASFACYSLALCQCGSLAS